MPSNPHKAKTPATQTRYGIKILWHVACLKGMLKERTSQACGKIN
jgi:hypothetical protein